MGKQSTEGFHAVVEASKTALLDKKARLELTVLASPNHLHAMKELTRVQFALRRIEEGQYGLCCDCGVPIQHDLLEAMPDTPFCQRCLRRIDGH